MDSATFIRLVRRTHPLQSLRIRFTENGIQALSSLYTLSQLNRRVRIDERDEMVVMMIVTSKNWGGDHNRTIRTHGLYALEEDALAAIAPYVERLELGGEHAAQGIMTNRQKTRDECVRQIVEGVCQKDLIDSLAGWGLSIKGEFALHEEIPSVQFRITNGDDCLFTVLVDGWSGRMAVDGSFALMGGELYTRPKQLRDLIMITLPDRLEELTAATA